MLSLRHIVGRSNLEGDSFLFLWLLPWTASLFLFKNTLPKLRFSFGPVVNLMKLNNNLFVPNSCSHTLDFFGGKVRQTEWTQLLIRTIQRVTCCTQPESGEIVKAGQRGSLIIGRDVQVISSCSPLRNVLLHGAHVALGLSTTSEMRHQATGTNSTSKTFGEKPLMSLLLRNSERPNDKRQTKQAKFL